MAYNVTGGFPQQQLPFSKKNKAWRKRVVDFGDDHSLLHYHLTRKSVSAMRVNYDLLNGKLHMADLKMLLNPFSLDASFIPDAIQHYPIMNSKLNVLLGEESERLFDFRVVVTNPNAVSEVEEERNNEVNARLQQLLANTSQSEEDYMKEVEKLSDYFQYEYQDKREVRANRLLNHYIRELDIAQLFNEGFVDALTVGEEAYICDIVGGEPTVEKIDPLKMRVIRSGYSSKIEDADIIILEDYWSLGRVTDTYWDQLTKKDVATLEASIGTGGDSIYADSMSNVDERYGFIPVSYPWDAGDAVINAKSIFGDIYEDSHTPFDVNGNVRVLRVFWKSKRKIKKVKSYDPETGEEQFDFYPETYYIDPTKGEEEEVFWINEAWEGTKIGKDIYVNVRPRPIQYNELSNPSRCHFGIIGSIYNINNDISFSLVDMMKPYSYLYDVVHDRLNKTLAKSFGKIVRMDFAKVPKGWDVDKWLYYIKVNNIAAEDSYKEGDIGRATGVLAGQMNNASSGVIDASLNNEIQQYMGLLEWISTKIGEIAGISRQREGQISNRETVGGVERATLQSSHITKRWFFVHDSVKKRVLECFLETAKIALKGRKKKFEYILSDGSRQITDIDGDEFSENDYGLVVENSNGVQELNQKLEVLSQAALQNQLIDFSTMMKLFTTISMSEKQRIVEVNEKRLREQQQQQQQQQMDLQQQQLQQQAQIAEQQSQLQYQMHTEDNETKIQVAMINSEAESNRLALMNEEQGLTRLEEMEYKNKELDQTAREWEAKIQQDKAKLELDKQKHKDDIRLKEKQLNIQAKKRTSK